MRNMKNMNSEDEFFSIVTRVLNDEIYGLEKLKQNLPSDLPRLIAALYNLRGKVILSGMGKSGHIAKKIAASLASTGTSAIYVHPGEASHGDLGMIDKDDLVILLSNSGETKELLDIIEYSKRFHIPLAGMMMRDNSTLAHQSDFKLLIPHADEASVIDAPTTSSLMMLALGDAITVAVHEAKGFTKDDFRVFHPGGKIGAQLARVEQLMHTRENIPVVFQDVKMSEALIEMTRKGFGCTAVLNHDNKNLIGIITDGDLRRHMDQGLLNMTAEQVMHAGPFTIHPKLSASEALAIMEEKAITSLLVTDRQNLVGILHIHDLLRVGVK